jgi:hypothetical protein
LCHLNRHKPILLPLSGGMRRESQREGRTVFCAAFVVQ